ncbi:trypsin-1 [Drosophila eugracilis]|uniref:trypsin-1 n=1 Tax=Drosophila eugracilis TaxID=29029 RepID=UPI0007E7A8E2|nr:trypsin-1 [Drosophila eugracilis]
MSQSALLAMQCLLLLLAAHCDGQNKAPEKNLYITGNFYQNVVSIRTRKHIRNWGDNHFCAGSILSKRWVVTSGCCVSTMPASTPKRSSNRKNMRVVVFTHKRLRKPLKENVFTVDKVVLDEENGDGCSKLALLKLDRVISGQRFALKLPLNKKNSTWLCRTIGWGRMYYEGPYSNELLQLRAEEIPTSTCKSDCSTCLCMASYTGRGNMCQLDQGSPLFCGTVLYGVARGVTCEDENYMVYTSIYHHRKFIEKTLTSASLQRGSKLSVMIWLLTWFFAGSIKDLSYSIVLLLENLKRI